MTFSRQQKGSTQRADIFAGWKRHVTSITAVTCLLALLYWGAPSAVAHSTQVLLRACVCSQHASWWLLEPYLLSMIAFTVQ